MICYGIGSKKVTLKRQKTGFSMKKGFESDAQQAKNARFSMLNGEKKESSMEKGIESDAWQAKSALFSMLKGKKQEFGMEKREKPPIDHIDLQAEGPECPFGLLLAPCRRVEVRSRAGNAVGGCLSRSEQAP